MIRRPSGPHYGPDGRAAPLHDGGMTNARPGIRATIACDSGLKYLSRFAAAR